MVIVYPGMYDFNVLQVNAVKPVIFEFPELPQIMQNRLSHMSNKDTFVFATNETC